MFCYQTAISIAEHRFKPLESQSPLQQMTFIDFQRKIRLDISCESSARQRIHMKYQAIFFAKDKRKKNFKYLLLQFLFGALYNS